MTMTVELTPDHVTQLKKLASGTGRGTDELMREAVENLQVGKAQIQGGELLEDEDVRERIGRMFRPTICNT